MKEQQLIAKRSEFGKDIYKIKTTKEVWKRAIRSQLQLGVQQGDFITKKTFQRNFEERRFLNKIALKFVAKTHWKNPGSNSPIPYSTKQPRRSEALRTVYRLSKIPIYKNVRLGQ